MQAKDHIYWIEARSSKRHKWVSYDGVAYRTKELSIAALEEDLNRVGEWKDGEFHKAWKWHFNSNRKRIYCKSTINPNADILFVRISACRFKEQ
jgi:hypothetical protein